MSPPIAPARPARGAPLLTVRCPGCGRPAHAQALHSPGGWVHAGRITLRTLLAHVECDLFALSAELSRAAAARSRLRVPALFRSAERDREG